MALSNPFSSVPEGLTQADIDEANKLYSAGGTAPYSEIIARAKIIRDDRLKREAQLTHQAAANQIDVNNAAKAASVTATNKAATDTATNTLTNIAATGGQAGADYVNSLVPGTVGYQPPQSNYAPPAPAFDQTAAAKQVGKIQYGAFGMSNAEVDALNLKLQGQANPGNPLLTTGMGTDNQSYTQNPNYRPTAPNQQGLPYGYTGPAPANYGNTAVTGQAPYDPTLAPPATTYAQPAPAPAPAPAPIQPQAPAPATPAAKLTQPTPPPVPSLQDLASGLLAKMQSRPR